MFFGYSMPCFSRTSMFYISLLCFASFFDFSCSPETPSLSSWSRDPIELQKQCDQEKIPELQITCKVQLASILAETSNKFSASEVCTTIENPTWRGECFFRVGEELGNKGDVADGLQVCALAEPFIQNCMTHTIWRNPTNTTISSQNSAKEIWQHYKSNMDKVIMAIQHMTPELQQESLLNWKARVGYTVFVGTGHSNPEIAHYALKKDDIFGASMRTGYAIETARIVVQKTISPDNAVLSLEQSKDIYTQILASWHSNIVITGEAKDLAYLDGKFYQAVLSPFSENLERIHLYGGGQRFIGENASEDIEIAILEGLFWTGKIPSRFWLSFFYTPHTPEDPSSSQNNWFMQKSVRLQYTAAKLFAISHGWQELSATEKETLQQTLSPDIMWYLTRPMPSTP